SRRRFVRIAALSRAEFLAGSGRRLRAARGDGALSSAAGAKTCWQIAAPARSRERTCARRRYHNRRRACRKMERADRFREINAAVTARADHARKSKDELDLRAGSRSVGASRARPARVDRGAATRWQNNFA